jgi:transcriptional regulator
VYRPTHFREDDPGTLAAFIDAHPLATLVMVTAEGLTANHIPLLRTTGGAVDMVLRGHVARGNDIWKTVAADGATLAVFGGADRYISPSWYPTKALTGEVVPTWNYSVVHAHGRIRFIDDAAWVHALVVALTERHEATRPVPWAVSDAPETYVSKMVRAIVGFEITVERLEGKFKSSQNRTEGERRGVSAGLQAQGVASEIQSSLVRDPR